MCCIDFNTPSRAGLAWARLGLAVLSTPVQAQSNLDPVHVLPTSGGSALVSAETLLDPRGVDDPAVRFAFGFATEEQALPSFLLDSFTVSLADSTLSSRVGYYLTADATGLQIAPATPGSIPVDFQSISLTLQPFPEGLTALPLRQAWLVTAAIPESLQNTPVSLHFDLFDNGDASGSLAWASAVGLVPEPATGALFLFGLGSWWLVSSLKRGRTR